MENIDWYKTLFDFKSYEGTISNFAKKIIFLSSNFVIKERNLI